MTQSTVQSTMIGQFEESEAKARLIAQRQQKLTQALLRFGWHSGTAEYRIALAFFHVSKNNGDPVLWTNQRIASDPGVAIGRHAMSIQSVSRAIRNLRRVGIMTQTSARDLGIVTYGRSNIQSREIDFGQVYQLAEGDLASARVSTSVSARALTSASARVSTSASTLGPDTYIPFSPISTSSKEGDFPSNSKASQEDLRAAEDEANLNSKENSETDAVCELLKTKLHPKTVRDLRDEGHLNGLTAQHVEQLIVEFDTAVAAGKLKSTGALATRIEHHAWPHDDVESYDAIIARQQAKQRREQHKAAVEAAERQRALKEKTEALNRQRFLEDRFGRALDAMTRDDRMNLARAVLTEFDFERYCAGKEDYREQLMAGLEGEVRNG